MKTNILVLFSIFLFISCSKEDSPEEIKQKQYPVYYTINSHIRPNDFALITGMDQMRLFIQQSLNTNVNTKYGNRGIFLIRWEGQTRAFDAACPYEWNNRVSLFESYDDLWKIGEKVTCTSCGSEYNPYTGQALSGKAKNEGVNMVQYKVEIKNIDGSTSIKELVVTN